MKDCNKGLRGREVRREDKKVEEGDERGREWKRKGQTLVRNGSLSLFLHFEKCGRSIIGSTHCIPL